MIQNIIKGTGAVGAVEILQQTELPVDSNLSEIFKLVLQLVITVATLLSMSKKKDSSNNQNQKL